MKLRRPGQWTKRDLKSRQQYADVAVEDGISSPAEVSIECGSGRSVGRTFDRRSKPVHGGTSSAPIHADKAPGFLRAHLRLTNARSKKTAGNNAHHCYRHRHRHRIIIIVATTTTASGSSALPEHQSRATPQPVQSNRQGGTVKRHFLGLIRSRHQAYSPHF